VKSTKVKKATKKKNSKKVYLKFKKVSGAQKYQIQISVNKKFKKKIINKKVNSKKISKNSKTVKFVLKNKKLKNSKKLYVRIRAIKVVKNRKYYSKWSKPKKIKIVRK